MIKFSIVILLMICLSYIQSTSIKVSTSSFNVSLSTSLSSIFSGVTALLSSFPSIPLISQRDDSKYDATLLSSLDPLASSILKAMTTLSKNGCFYRGEICYKHVGCFNTTSSASKLTCSLPEMPSFIRTRFLLYTPKNSKKDIGLRYENDKNMDKVPKKEKITFILHGYTESGIDADYIMMKDLLLTYTNIVVVDYKIAVRIGNFLRAIVNTELVGRQLGTLIGNLYAQRDIHPSDMHIIGFSLGVKVAHFASVWVKQNIDKTIGRITGLDPGDHLADTSSSTNLNPSDANFVDVIHTSALNPSSLFTSIKRGGLGLTLPLGHVDFYPNGKSQPWCTSLTSSILCNHVAARKFFIASFSCAFRSKNCLSWNIWNHEPCTLFNKNPSSSSLMGYFSITETGRGIQYLKIDKRFPFC